MYQNCCKKCGSVPLHTEVKGNNTGLYCDDCGAWIKWLGKDELRAFEHSMREATKEERESVHKYVESISKPTGVNFYDNQSLFEKLKNILMDYFDINGDTYAYNLTRDKAAFGVGTMAFDDFEEFSEETIDDIVKYIKENI